MPIEPVELLKRLTEHFSSEPTWQERARYFPPGRPQPGEPDFEAELERINDSFRTWLDPGPVEAPPRDALEREEGFVRFPSALPGRAGDRVVLRLYEPPEDPPPVVVLFHPWLYFRGWMAVDWLLAPLRERFRVAVMEAPYHLDRALPGCGSGEGFIDPNPLHAFRGFRQWQADHLATCAFLSREAGGAPVLPVGYSLGGYGLVLHRLLRPAVPSVVICTPSSYARGVFEGSHGEHLRRQVLEAGISRQHFEHLTRALDLARWGPAIGGSALTWIFARRDDIEPEESLRAARNAIEPERVVAVPGGHASALLSRRRICDEIVRRVEALLRPHGA